MDRSKNKPLDLDDIEDLETEGFARYAQSICLTADSFEQAQKSLRLSMPDVPEAVRDKVVARAVLERTSQTSSTQNSEIKLGTEGCSHS
jgi:hypothetical protein